MLLQLGRAHFLEHSRLGPHTWKRLGTLPGLFISDKDTNPYTRAAPSRLNPSQRPHPLIPHTGPRVSEQDLGVGGGGPRTQLPSLCGQLQHQEAAEAGTAG